MKSVTTILVCLIGLGMPLISFAEVIFDNGTPDNVSGSGNTSDLGNNPN